MLYNSLYRLTIEAHSMLRRIAKIMAWIYGLTCVVFYINVNLNNLSYWTMKEPALRFVAAYAFMKGSYLIRDWLLRLIVERAHSHRVAGK